MIGGRNENHYKSFEEEVIVESKPEVIKVEKKVEEKKEDKKVEVVEKQEETVIEPITRDYLYSLTKSEQVEALEEIGIEKSDIKKLKKEKDRVEKLLELLNWERGLNEYKQRRS